MWFNNLSVSKKIALCFAGVVCVVVAMSVSTFVTLNKARAVGVQNDYSREELSNSADTLSALVEEQNAVRGLVASGDESFADKIKTAGDQVAASLQTMTATNTDPDDAANIAALKQAITEVHTQEQAQIAGASDPAKRVATQATIAASGRLTQVRTLLKAITDPESAKLARRAPIEDADFAMARDVLIGGGVLSMLLSAALGWMLSRAIARPVADMTGAMTKLAAGDNTVEVPAAGRKDEIGAMAEAVQTFKTAAIEKIALEAKAADQRRGAEDTRRASEAERAAAAEEQAGVVGAIATGLEKLSGGVLTFRIGQAFAPAYEKLRTDFNAAMQQLQDTMKVVADNAGGIRSGAGEISQASDDLSRRTEQQAASLEETAAALDQITATVRKTAEGSNQARETVSVAKSDAETSGGVVREAISAMGEIEDSARQISQIISVIDEIAFQTNLLALNAGVEAARAGDAGKGFAVVASEVRALAQRSAEAAKEIKALISASSQQVDRGVNLVGQTGKALERIVVQVGEINGVVAEIAASAQEQAAGLAQVNTAVNQMDQVTQQNAAMVEQSTAASHALAHEAEELARLIARFDLGQTSNVESIRKPSPRHEAPVTALKTIGGRGAPATVRRPDPQDEQGWAEF